MACLLEGVEAGMKVDEGTFEVGGAWEGFEDPSGYLSLSEFSRAVFGNPQV